MEKYLKSGLLAVWISLFQERLGMPSLLSSGGLAAKTILLLSLLLITSWTAYGDAPVASTAEQPPQVIQDPKTKVVYYLESDRRHVAAINPSGKLLWCQELFFASDRFRISIQSIDFWHTGDYPFETGSGDDYISVKILVHAPAFGGTRGVINKKTGFFNSEPIE